MKKFGSHPEGSRSLLPSAFAGLLLIRLLGGNLIQFRAKEKKGQGRKNVATNFFK
jgi:hypothetical protein